MTVPMALVGAVLFGLSFAEPEITIVPCPDWTSLEPSQRVLGEDVSAALRKAAAALDLRCRGDRARGLFCTTPPEATALGANLFVHASHCN